MTRGASATEPRFAFRSNPSSVMDAFARVPLWLWAVLAAVAMATFGIANNIAVLRIDYGDVDDALRMVQVRELMSSGRWFDTTMPRIGGPEGMLSHWSRLIDLPLALLIALFGLALPPASAELVTRMVWPVLLLLPLLCIVLRTVDSAAGRTSALIALLLLLASPAALIQFAVGRIDHHNAQNLGAVGAVLLLWSLGRVPQAGRWAGLCAGLAIAVGYEALPLVIVTTAAATLMGLWTASTQPAIRDGVCAYLETLAITVALAFVATTSPGRWMDVRCDALSLNMVLLLGSGAAGVSLALGGMVQRAFAPRFAPVARAQWALVAAGGLAGAVVFGLAEPKCLAGPLGQVPSQLKSIWLDHVGEAKSWADFLVASPPGALSSVALFGLAIAAQGTHWRRQGQVTEGFYLIVLLVAIALACWQIKYMPYASILAIAPIAITIGRLKSVGDVSALMLRFLAVVGVNQWTLVILAAIAAPALTGGTGQIATSGKEIAKACFQQQNLAELGALPKGLMFAPIDLGSHLLADTHHDVLAAPYHRIGPPILESHAILASTTPAVAEQGLRRIGATYVVVCPALTGLITPVGDDVGTFHARLVRGELLPFLEPVALKPGAPFKLWRVRPRISALQ